MFIATLIQGNCFVLAKNMSVSGNKPHSPVSQSGTVAAAGKEAPPGYQPPPVPPGSTGPYQTPTKAMSAGSGQPPSGFSPMPPGQTPPAGQPQGLLIEGKYFI